MGSGDGEEEKAESFLREDITMVHSKPVIVEDDQDYQTDGDFGKTYHGRQKKPPKITDKRVVVVRKVRGKCTKTLRKEEQAKNADTPRGMGGTPIPNATSILVVKNDVRRPEQMTRKPHQKSKGAQKRNGCTASSGESGEEMGKKWSIFLCHTLLCHTPDFQKN